MLGRLRISKSLYEIDGKRMTIFVPYVEDPSFHQLVDSIAFGPHTTALDLCRQEFWWRTIRDPISKQMLIVSQQQLDVSGKILEVED